MRRRMFLAASAAALVTPAIAQAQLAIPGRRLETPQQPQAQPRRVDEQRIEPRNELERTFLEAFDNAQSRPAFRRQLLESNIALVVSGNSPDAPPGRAPLANGAMTCMIYTSAARAVEALGEDTPRVIMTGRAALELARGSYVTLNARLSPTLVLEAEDVETLLAIPETPAAATATPRAPTAPPDSAGPTQ